MLCLLFFVWMGVLLESKLMVFFWLFISVFFIFFNEFMTFAVVFSIGVSRANWYGLFCLFFLVVFFVCFWVNVCIFFIFFGSFWRGLFSLMIVCSTRGIFVSFFIIVRYLLKIKYKLYLFVVVYVIWFFVSGCFF